MKSFTGSLCALAIHLSPTSLSAQANGQLLFPRLNVEDHGGRLGLTTDGPYAWHGIQVLKVDEVQRQSGLYGVIYPGDFVYGVNGFNLRSPNDLFAIVSYGSPGSINTIWYLDSRHNFTAMKVTVRAVSPAVFAEQLTSSPRRSEGSVSARGRTDAGTVSKSFCEEHYIICGLGVVVGAAAVASAMSGSGGSSASDVSTTARDDSDLYRQRQTSSSGSSSAPDTSRSYGLHGDCPLAGAGYGC